MIEMRKSLEPVMDCMEKNLTLKARRQDIIANNLANLDTPTYTGKDLDFEATLANFLGRGSSTGLTRTSAAHLPGVGAATGLIIEDSQKEVDIDQEMVRLTQNSIQYQATVQMLVKKLQTLKTAIDGGSA